MQERQTNTSLPTDPALPTGTVTFLFSDIVGSTSLWERQPDRMAEALKIHNTALQEAIESHGGTVFKTVGDAFQAAFPTAPQALRAAIAGQCALKDAPWNELGELKVRMGLHTGEAELDPGGDEYAVSHTKNRVARIMSTAHGGQTLLSQETKDLVDHQLPEGVSLKDLGEHRLKGMAMLENLFQVETPELSGDFPPLATRVEHPHNLPTRLTSFIGRQSEIESVCDSLLREDTRLLTITGVGGTGKTSLAIQAGRMLLTHFKDGIFFADLTKIHDPGLVMSMIAQVLSVHELPGRTLQDVLEEHLSRRILLLILDNFEHVLTAAPGLVGLLRVAPRLKFLVTSREPLHVSPERLNLLAPLRLPDTPESLVELQENEAVSLFIERSQAVKPGLRLTAENATDIAAICRHLDGLPLAIELAAPRLRLYSPYQLHQQLAERLRLLSGGPRDAPIRHQTMRAAIAWSYDLLSEEEQNLLGRVSVFPGSFSLEAAIEVCGYDGLEVDFGMASLIDKSLINRRNESSGLRFWLFETVRDYAQDQLPRHSEPGLMRRKHAMYYAQLCSIDPQRQNYHLYDLELHNLRAGFKWAIETQDVGLVHQLGANFFAWEKQVNEGRRLIAAALALPAIQTQARVQFDLLYSASALAMFSRDIPATREYIRKRSVIKIENDYDTWSQSFLTGILSIAEGDFEGAIEIFKRIVGENQFRNSLSDMLVGACLLQLHQFSSAASHALRAQKQLETLWQPNPYVVDCLTLQGYIAVEEKAFQTAWVFFSQAFRLALKCAVQERLASIYIGLGGAANQAGDYAAAATWTSLAEVIKKSTGFVSRVLIDSIEERYLQEVKRDLHPGAFEDVWDAGQALTLEQAVNYGAEIFIEST